MRQARHELGARNRAEYSARIAVHILRWLDALEAAPRTVAIYLASPLEASLDALIEPLQARGVRVVAPRGAGLAVLEAASTGFAPSGQSWRQADGQPVEIEEIDVALLPGLSFGRDGSRLGQGGGWFDRALLGSRAILIGVAFGCQIVDALPIEPHDVSMQWIVSENGIVEAAPRQEEARR